MFDYNMPYPYIAYGEIAQRGIPAIPFGPPQEMFIRPGCRSEFQRGFSQGFRQGFRQGFQQGQRECFRPTPYPR